MNKKSMILKFFLFPMWLSLPVSAEVIVEPNIIPMIEEPILEPSPPPNEEEFYIPVQDGRYRAENNLAIFHSNKADQYRIPSIVNIGDGELLFFSEKRVPELVGDTAHQDIVMRRYNRESQTLGQELIIQHNQDWSEDTSLMNPTTVHNATTGTTHLFFNQVVGKNGRNVHILHSMSNDRGYTWSKAAKIPQVVGECETSMIGTGQAIILSNDMMYRDRIVVPLHTVALESDKDSNCSDSESASEGTFYTMLSDDNGESWNRSYGTLTTGSTNGTIGESQIVYMNRNKTIYMFSRLKDSSDYGYDGTGIGYSRDGGHTWFRGFYPNPPYDESGERIGLTGRFVTPTQSGLSTDGENLYYTTSVHWEDSESLSVRKEGWIHKFNPDQMLVKTDSPILNVQPITKSGISNISTLYLGQNRLGIIWEEVQTWKPIKQILGIYYTELDIRDFRPILDPAWVERGFIYHPTKNGSHHLLNSEINEGNKSGEWDPQ